MKREELEKEIKNLKNFQKEIENGSWREKYPNKSKSTYWEHELGWLDCQCEIEIIQKEIERMKTPGQVLYECYKSIFVTMFKTPFSTLDEMSQKQWNQVANKFLSQITVVNEELDGNDPTTTTVIP
jgi:hypothetical protein